MSERNTFRSYEGKILTLPIIKDKKIKNEVLSVITLFKLGDKI
jgi:hypothetical protein